MAHHRQAHTLVPRQLTVPDSERLARKKKRRRRRWQRQQRAAANQPVRFLEGYAAVPHPVAMLAPSFASKTGTDSYDDDEDYTLDEDSSSGMLWFEFLLRAVLCWKCRAALRCAEPSCHCYVLRFCAMLFTCAPQCAMLCCAEHSIAQLDTAQHGTLWCTFEQHMPMLCHAVPCLYSSMQVILLQTGTQTKGIVSTVVPLDLFKRGRGDHDNQLRLQRGLSAFQHH